MGVYTAWMRESIHDVTYICHFSSKNKRNLEGSKSRQNPMIVRQGSWKIFMSSLILLSNLHLLVVKWYLNRCIIIIRKVDNNSEVICPTNNSGTPSTYSLITASVQCVSRGSGSCTNLRLLHNGTRTQYQLLNLTSYDWVNIA